MKKNAPDQAQQRSIGIGMLFGVAIGLMIGTGLGNTAAGVGLGLAIGTGIGATGVFTQKKQ